MAFTSLSGAQTYWPIATYRDAHFNARLKRLSFKNIAMIITIIIMALAVTTAVFAVLYFRIELKLKSVRRGRILYIWQ